MVVRNPNRTVHATLPNHEVVRYERAGKWWLEGTGDLAGHRTHVTIGTAAKLATLPDATVHFGRRGGSAFDRLVRRNRILRS